TTSVAAQKPGVPAREGTRNMAAATTRRRARRIGALALTVVTTMVATTLGSAPAQAAVQEPPRPAFYETPAALPAANGAVIRREKLTYLLDPLDATSLVRNSHRILYKSTNRAG